MRAPFLRALRDHLMRWDPDARRRVDEVCQNMFKLTFDQMLLRNPRFILVRTPRHIPKPSVLVPALQYIFDSFGNALDVKTKQPLFSSETHKKANAILELARQGYLSDVDGIALYETAGTDKLTSMAYKSTNAFVEQTLLKEDHMEIFIASSVCSMVKLLLCATTLLVSLNDRQQDPV